MGQGGTLRLFQSCWITSYIVCFRCVLGAALQFNGVFGLSLTAGVGFYFYLAFIELSWDIMEPITYFTGTAISIVGV